MLTRSWWAFSRCRRSIRCLVPIARSFLDQQLKWPGDTLQGAHHRKEALSWAALARLYLLITCRCCLLSAGQVLHPSQSLLRLAFNACLCPSAALPESPALLSFPEPPMTSLSHAPPFLNSSIARPRPAPVFRVDPCGPQITRRGSSSYCKTSQH